MKATKAMAALCVIVTSASLSACNTDPAAGVTDETGRGVHADISGVKDARGLVRESELVVIGVPEDPRVLSQLQDGSTDYIQRIDVEAVLKGNANGTIEVIRNGDSADADDLAEGRVAEDGTRGPLPTTPQVLFLIRGGQPDSWSISGHFQGAMDFKDGRVANSVFEVLNGKSRRELEEFIRRQG